MTQSDGEKELVLGNKQLISLFFVVVALCGVFFAMGYMIGRNSTKAALTGAATNSEGGIPALVVPPQPQPEPPRQTPTDAAPAAVDQSDAVQTKPAQDVPSRTSAPAPQEEKPARAAAGDIAVAATEAGASYLQVTALPRADAESVVRTLQEQNFPAILAESSKDGLFRVLVGPYHQTTQLAEAKARLKILGFANAFVQKQ